MRRPRKQIPSSKSLTINVPDSGTVQDGFEELVAAKTRFVCTSYIVAESANATMRRLGLLRAFTNDRHFATAGFEVLF